jgi:ATP-dependent Clp protease ATP-binding subunit ClpC
VGYEEGGQLTEKVRRRPYSVVLFDEIEKAHPDVFNLLLQVLEEGVLTDAQGRRADFKNAVVIMTSNVGAQLLRQKQSFGFADSENAETGNKNIRDAVLGELRKSFRPEFINRIDEIIVFRQLTRNETRQIAKGMLAQSAERLLGLNITVSFSEPAIEKISALGFDPLYGARPLRRVIQTRIEDRLSELILEGKIERGGAYLCGVREEDFIFEKTDDKVSSLKKGSF